MRRLQSVLTIVVTLIVLLKVGMMIMSRLSSGSYTGWTTWVFGSLASIYGVARVRQKIGNDKYFKAACKKSVAVILLCGGEGKRMHSDTPKQFMMLQGKAVCLRCFDTLVMHPYTVSIVVVCEDKYRNIFTEEYNRLFPAWKRLTDDAPHLIFADNSRESRHESMLCGFNALQRSGIACSAVAIHDGARPLLTSEDFTRVCNDAYEAGAAILATQCKPTLKRVDEAGNFVSSTIDRSELWEAQTPQVFKKEVLIDGLSKFSADQEAPTDDSMLVESITNVKVTRGSSSNIKLTSPEDLKIAEAILSSL